MARRHAAVGSVAAEAGHVPAGQQESAARAALWMAGAVASFSLMAIAGREMSAELDTFEIMLYRSVVGFVLVLAFGATTARLPSARTARLGLHGLRNVLHFTGQNLWFYALATIPLAQVFAFEFTSPLWVAVLAPLLLGEAFTRARATAAVAGFVGILLVARPGVSSLEVGHAAAALAAVFFAGNFLTTKRLSRHSETTFRILFWMTLMQSVFGLITAGVDGDIAVPLGITALWILPVGICGLTAHLCVTSALHWAPASAVAPMDFARLPIIAVLGMLVYGEPLEVPVFVGGAVILAGILINIRGERRRR